MIQFSIIFTKFSKSGKTVDPEYRMTPCTIGKFKVSNYKICYLLQIFYKFRKFFKNPENCWFWVQNDSIYNRKYSRFRNIKIAICFNFRLFSEIFKFQENCWFWVQNDSIYNRKYSRFRNIKFAICFINFLAFSENFQNPGKMLIPSTEWLNLQ